MKTKLSVLVMLLSVLMFSACTTTNQTGTVGQAQAYNVHYGKIVSIHQVNIDNPTEQTAGGLLGGIAGAALGSTIGSGSGRTIATALGGALGLIGGAALGSQVNGNALEIIVETDQGLTLSVIERNNVDFQIGQRVKVMLGNNFSRIDPA